MNNEQKSNRWWHYFSIGSKPGRIPELDGLRACAILLVLFYHFATVYGDIHRSYYRKVIDGATETFMLNGWLGVDLFFVLSGFLIFNHLLSLQRQPNKMQTYGRYALKRVLRTFPLYYAIIAILLLGLIPYYQVKVPLSEVAIHLVFLQDYLGSDILVPLWSLATEEKFYLLAPFLLLVLSRLSLGKGLVCLLAFMLIMLMLRTVLIQQNEAIAGYDGFFWSYRAPFHFAILSIFVGVVVAMLVQQDRAPRMLPVLALVASVLIVLLLCFMNMFQPENWQQANLGQFVIVLLFGVLIWAAVKNTGAWGLRLLTGRFLRIISVLSYALYLVHYAVLPWVSRLHKQHIYSEEPWVHALTYFGMYIGITFAVSLVLHYVVEKPFLIIKDRL